MLYNPSGVVGVDDDGRPLFILAGNGPYENRGCEAIVRGTTKILREHFNNPRFVCFSFFPDGELFRRQSLQETDGAITHLHAYRRMTKAEFIKNIWRPSCWGYACDRIFRPDALKYRLYRQMLPYLGDADAVLSVGGDNYSLDYGIPTRYTDLDDVVLRKNKPIIIWGASVGPFSAIPEYERYMSSHLREVTGIFARESMTVEYLNRIGVVENVHPVADPAFLMDPVKPRNDPGIDGEAIGINLSPLMARYTTGGDIEAWAKMAAGIIAEVAERTDLPIYLIAHVTIPIPHTDDHAFMQRVLSLIEDRKKDITLISPIYNAAETKWIIGRMAVFAGARTHATIAALSSGVPTLSFAYSIKARGINRDIFGHESYVHTFEEHDTSAPVEKISALLERREDVEHELQKRVPGIRAAALEAGRLLRHRIGEV